MNSSVAQQKLGQLEKYLKLQKGAQLSQQTLVCIHGSTVTFTLLVELVPKRQRRVLCTHVLQAVLTSIKHYSHQYESQPRLR